jgi:hypothetical protein
MSPLEAASNLYRRPPRLHQQRLGSRTSGSNVRRLVERHHDAVLPPLTAMTWPVMNEALAEAAKTMASAISSGLPTRFSGTPATISTASTIYRTVAQALPAGRPAMARCSHGIRLEELEQERDDVVGRNAGDDHRRDLRQNLQDSAHSGA